MKKIYFILMASMLLTIGTSLSAQSFSIWPGGIVYEEGYVGTTMFSSYSGYPFPDTYVWSATWEGSCDRWYLWPDGNHADVSVYFTSPEQEGGVLRIECKAYYNSNLLATAYYYLDVYPE